MNEYVLTAIIFIIFSLTSISIRPSSLNADEAAFDFGAEYGNIAASVAKGEGFANVFTDESGPTAWHPPLNVYLMALVFVLFGVKSYASMWILFLIRNAAFAFTAFYLLKISDKSGFGRYRLLVVIFFVLLILLNKNPLLYRVDDVYLITFISSILVYAMVSFVQKPSRKSFILLYILAFILPLTIPSMALAFVVLLFAYFMILSFQIFRNTKERGKVVPTIFRHPSLRAIVISGFIFIAAVSVWSYRNYLVFDTFIPIKSNLWAEFYFANVLDDDGILSTEFYRKHHPSKGNYALDEYLSQGEVQFVAESKNVARQHVKQAPSIYLKKVGNRIFNALVHTDHISDTKPASLSLFSEEELLKLQEAQLLILEQWTSLKLSRKEFIEQIKPLHLKNEQAAIDDWAKQKKAYMNRKYSIIHLTLGAMVALVPFICFVIGLFIKNIRKNIVFIVTSVIYFVHLLPYLLVSHQFRYQYAMVALQAIFMFLVAYVVITAIYPLPEKPKRRVLQEI